MVRDKMLHEYLEKQSDHLPLFNDVLTAYEDDMRPTCIATVIIPVYNEEEKIRELLQSFENQIFDKEYGLGHDCFEIVIIENNSTDNTTQIAKSHVKNKIKNSNITIASLKYDRKNGASLARKLGMDSALARLKNRKIAFDEFYLFSLDADEIVPPNYLENTVKVFRQTKADVLNGEYFYATHDLPEDNDFTCIIKTLNSYIHRRTWDPEVISCLLGGNFAITYEMYIKASGYPIAQVGDDYTFWGKLKNENAKISWSHISLEEDPRRVWANPLETLTGEAWHPKTFDKNHEVRQKNNNTVEGFTDEEIKIAITTYTDWMAFDMSLAYKIPIDKIILLERDHFIKLATLNGVRPELLPDGTLYKVDRLNNIRNIRVVMNSELKKKLLDMEIRSFVYNFLEPYHFFDDHMALFFQNQLNLKSYPSLFSFCVGCDDVVKVYDDFNSKGYKLYKYFSYGPFRYFKKIELENRLLEEKDIYFIKHNVYDVPFLDSSNYEKYYEQDPLFIMKLNVYPQSHEIFNSLDKVIYKANAYETFELMVTNNDYAKNQKDGRIEK